MCSALNLGAFVDTLLTSTSPLSKSHQLRLGSAQLGLIISTHVIGSASPPPVDMCSAWPHNHNKYMLGSASSSPTDMCSARSDTGLTRRSPTIKGLLVIPHIPPNKE
ncbi:hypothetical protein Pyn_05486 [Prunus yedoensis var. nudiflora]|uniref:Uncharacterized protein n=1 Tax=Prunus yedoensis var. nudiflora TaxID=2094558 RepID=A0A314YWW8_PRUYE|nr:hypothetical protein Pyn_05486 [Prunus yedoensis var. nudiflora]